MNFIATIHENSISRIDEIVASLQKIARVDRILRSTGVITGYSNKEFSELKKIDKGIKSIEKDRPLFGL